MVTVKISAKKREGKERSKVLAMSSLLPAVVYGHGFDPQSLVVDYQEFRRAYIKAGETTIIDLDIEGKSVPVLVKEVQFHPVSDKMQHIDFFKVNLKEKIKAHVPVVFIGTAPAVKNMGGILTHQLDHIDVECLPNEIPHEFEVDVTGMVDFDGVVYVKDMPAIPGVEILNDGDQIIASIVAPKVEVESELTPQEMEAQALAEVNAADNAEANKEE